MHPVTILISSAILLCLFPLNFDIGNTLDPDLSAYDMYRQIEKIPDGSVVFNWCETVAGQETLAGGNEQVGIAYYNRVTGKRVVPLNTGWLMISEDERDVSEIERWGLIVPDLVTFHEKDDEVDIKVLENMRRLKIANPDRKFYITRTITDEVGNKYNFGRILIEW